MSAPSDYGADHPIVEAWMAFKASPAALAVITHAPTRSGSDDYFPVFEAGWNALRDMMQAAPVYLASSTTEVANILGNTLAQAGMADPYAAARARRDKPS